MRKQYILIEGEKVLVSSDLLTKNSEGVEYTHYLPDMVDGMYVPDLSSLLDSKKEAALELLKVRADYISDFVALSISTKEFHPDRKKHSYKAKEDWAKEKLVQIQNSEPNIDYSPYEQQAIRFNPMKDVLGIVEADVNKAYVYIVNVLALAGKEKLAVVEENEYRLEGLIDSSTIETIDGIVSSIDTELKVGI